MGGMSKPNTAAGVPSEEAINAVEFQLSLFWRRTRAVTRYVSQQIHPEMDPSAYGLLTMLAHNGGMRLTDLATEIGVGKPSISRQVTFLESIGLVEKAADPHDGRAQNITLTAAGATKMAAIQKARRAAFHEQLGGWSEDELRQFSSLMGRLNEDYARGFAQRTQQTI